MHLLPFTLMVGRLSALYPMTLYSGKKIFAHYPFMYFFFFLNHQDLCKPTKLLETDTVSLQLLCIIL